LRPERESDPRIEVLQTPAFPLRHPARAKLYFIILERKWLRNMLNSAEMKTFWTVVISLISFTLLVLSIFFLMSVLKPKPAEVFIDSNPISNVYIDDAFVGKTPYTGQYNPREIAVKMVPEVSSDTLFPYQTKVSLVPGVRTVVSREFGATEDLSSGQVVLFERIARGETLMVALSIPENAQVSVDGAVKGFAPYKVTGISPGKHQITIKAPEYIDRVMTVSVVSGFRLTVFAKLAKSGEGQKIVEQPIQKVVMVEILKTPTGFLRVRTKPGVSGEEIAQVKVGETYKFIEEDTLTKWLRIQFEDPKAGLPDGITGWVSGEYVKKVEVAGEATQSASVIR